MKDIECPYCGHGQEVCHDDGFGYEEGVAHQMQCERCDNNFVFYTSISFFYEPEKADCLNDGEHNWKAQNCHPSRFTQMQCTMCGETRKPTAEEMKDILNQ